MNCKIIWGSHYHYDFDIETDDYVHYYCYVKRDFGDSYGPPLTITCVCVSSDAAWAELDRMLELWAKQIRSGTPITRDVKLKIFGGPNGEYKSLLKKVWNEFERNRDSENKAGSEESKLNPKRIAVDGKFHKKSGP